MVEGIFTEDLVAGTFVFFMITNFYVDISEPRITKSWVMTVWTKEGYFVDQISDGLDFEYKCSVPC